MKITAELLAALSKKEKKEFMKPLADAMNEFFPQYKIDTKLRICHFLAQAAHESDGFHTMMEYASGKAYEKRTDLGNTKEDDGDGPKYKGRGIFQLTGKNNYERMGKVLGLDLVKEPERAAEPHNAVWIACQYWKDKSLNTFADKDDINTITKKINGGFNGLTDRIEYLRKAKDLVN